MSNARMHFGGIPTEPDIAKLRKEFGAPEPGMITHDRIEAVIGLQPGTSRYRTVVGAWRARLLRENNLATRAEPGDGVRILTEPERVDEGRRMLGLNARQAMRQHRWNLMVDVSKLDDIARHKHDHTLRASSAMAVAAQTNVKELAAALKAPAQLPRGKVG